MSTSPNSTDSEDDGLPDWWSAAAALFGALTAFSGLNYAAVGRAIGLIVDDPIQFVREFIYEGLLVIVAETFIRGFFGLLGQVGAELQLVAAQFWDATVGTLLRVGASTRGLLEPAIRSVQVALSGGLTSLGVAAPLAAALSIAVTVVLVVLVTTVAFELLRWALPLGALTRPVTNALSGARNAASRTGSSDAGGDQ